MLVSQPKLGWSLMRLVKSRVKRWQNKEKRDKSSMTYYKKQGLPTICMREACCVSILTVFLAA